MGPLQIPVADVAVMAQSHFNLTGAATSIGERPYSVRPASLFWGGGLGIWADNSTWLLPMLVLVFVWYLVVQTVYCHSGPLGALIYCINSLSFLGEDLANKSGGVPTFSLCTASLGATKKHVRNALRRLLQILPSEATEELIRHITLDVSPKSHLRWSTVDSERDQVRASSEPILDFYHRACWTRRLWLGWRWVRR